MRGLDFLTPRQIRNRARQFHASRAMRDARRQIEFCHAQHYVAALILQLTKLFILPDAHIRLCWWKSRYSISGICERDLLNVSGGSDSRPNRIGRLTLSPSAFRTPRAGLRCKCRFYRVMGPRYALDIMSAGAQVQGISESP
jgi:hypothetical protein